MQPLSEQIPCLDAIQYAFVNPPQIELDFTGLANIADFQMMDIKGMIRTMMQDVISSMMVLPVKMSFLMNPAVDYRDMYSSSFLGLARITVHSGRGFRPEKLMLRGHDIPDVYLKIKLGYEPQWRTKTVHNELNPKWDPQIEFHDFLLCSKEQIVEIEAHDEDGGSMDSDDFLGNASVTVGQILLLAKGAAKTLEVELVKKESKGSIRPTGHFVTISLSILPFTTGNLTSVTKAIKNKEKDNKKAAGLLTILIQGAHDLPLKKENAASFVKVWYGEKELGVTGVVVEAPGYDALNPVFQTPFHLPLTVADLAKADESPVKMQLINGESTVLGEIVIPQKDVVKAANGTIRGEGKIGKGGASLSYQVMLSGIETNAARIAAASALGASATAAISGDGATSSSQEMIRVSITKGYGFKSRKKGPFKKKDIPDVYCLVKFASFPSTWRTTTVKDSETPTWKNESREFPLQSANQIITIEVWDANSKSKDELYGTSRTSVGKVLLNGGSLDVEVVDSRQHKTGIFITLQCQKL
jgi:Ca2+-dependent lipid-binding protein